MIIAGVSSGAGKTTVAAGLMTAFSRLGRRVAPFKVGPDFIDPGYHRLAAGCVSRNLDAWMCGDELVRPLFLRGARTPRNMFGMGADLLGQPSAPADLAIVEGVMGLFDGVSGSDDRASTAHVARLLQAPIILVVDAKATGRSVGALVHGYRTWDPRVELAGLIFNRVGSSHHAEILCDAVRGSGVPVLGCLPRADAFVFRDRHLGLVPVVEDPQGVQARLEILATQIADCLDLGLVESIARSAPPLAGVPWAPPSFTSSLERTEAEVSEPSGVTEPEASELSGKTPDGAPLRIGVAGGPVFSFLYPENLEVLAAAGAELVSFDALTETLPEGISGLYFGGGFPEVHAGALSANGALRREVRAAVHFGVAVYAECGGMLYLSRAIDGVPMVGAFPFDVHMGDRLHLGYAEGTALTDSPVALQGKLCRGHVFHYTAVAETIGSIAPTWSPMWHLKGRRLDEIDGVVVGRTGASYLHMHWAGDPSPAHRFLAVAAAGPRRRAERGAGPRAEREGKPA